MPKSLLFAPFERAMISEEDKAVSLIGLIRTITIGVPVGAEPPGEDVGIPTKWYVFCTWEKEPGDEGKIYEQKVQLVSPRGRDIVAVTVKFALSTQTHHVINPIHLLPASPPGDCSLSLMLRTEDSREWATIAKYPITIAHNVEPPN